MTGVASVVLGDGIVLPLSVCDVNLMKTAPVSVVLGLWFCFTSELNEVVISYTNDFNNWQQKQMIVDRIRVDIIKKLVRLSKIHSAINKETVDYIAFAEQLMKYIIQHY